MELLNQLRFFTSLDAIAVSYLLLSWMVLGYIIESPPKSRVSTSVIMADYRRKWMVQMITRQPRIFDAAVLDTLRQGTAFFGSACLIAIGGGLAAISNTERLRGVAQDLTIDVPEIIWEMKILLALILITSAFLKFIWANRLFGYCGVVMASVPNEIDAAETLPRAKKAGELNIAAARAFNRGLRGIYFALGALGWFLGPIGLLITTTMTVFILVRREFASASREVLLQDET
ncbi:DUF599 domain-containing protein [Pacificibacter marinus]|uniref:DUF599 domain-containing protein n=1 Tax=Pacificibacter marinus TaxID=658057 RepID=A0A1Y5S8Z9_9RHOB|nr:DUF599 domain-containing protein [Pacificibacter marinus]SEK75661.1 Uncharacterized membrane protein [Pacificibacter marinus]SLN34894.1 hypothetical protein PAM7971_01526 [Pacificibacter marinus]